MESTFFEIGKQVRKRLTTMVPLVASKITAAKDPSEIARVLAEGINGVLRDTVEHLDLDQISNKRAGDMFGNRVRETTTTTGTGTIDLAGALANSSAFSFSGHCRAAWGRVGR